MHTSTAIDTLLLNIDMFLAHIDVSPHAEVSIRTVEAWRLHGSQSRSVDWSTNCVEETHVCRSVRRQGEAGAGTLVPDGQGRRCDDASLQIPSMDS